MDETTYVIFQVQFDFALEVWFSIQGTSNMPSIHQTRRRSVLVHKGLTTAPAGAAHMYSKTCVNRALSKRPEIGFQSQLSLNAGQKYCRMLQILSTSFKLPFVIKIFVLSIFEWPFYTCFAVHYTIIDFNEVDIRIYPPKKVIIHRGR